LGDGSTASPLRPVRISGLENVVGVAVGSGADYALLADGSVWGWGGGQNLPDQKSEPAALSRVSGLSDIQAIVTTGFGARYALKRDGTVWTWWGTSTAQVPGLDHITKLETTETSAYALRDDGTVWAWGANQYGQLGDGTTIDRPNPVPVLSLRRVQSIAAGFYCAFAMQEGGKVWAWGYNGNGLLGDGSETDRNVPVLISQPGIPLHQ
jgi:alpha-tubulin suppressor-like RCC1 family protein